MPQITGAGSLPTRTGYTFNGYYDAVGGGTKYYNADGTSAKKWNKASATTLYAQWTPKTTTLSLDDQGGSGGTLASTTATYDAAMPELSAIPTKIKYIFEGYYTGTGGTGTKYYHANKTQAQNWMEDIDGGTKTLYAYWVLAYTVTIAPPLNGTLTASPEFGGKNDSITVTPTPNPGYRLNWTYWHNHTISPGIIHDITSTLQFNLPADNVTVSGDFKPNVTTVKYHANNGTGIVEDLKNTFDAATVKPAVNPFLFGYTFVGWNVSDGGGWKDFDSDAYNKSGTWNYTGDHNGNLNVYANFTVNLHNLSINSTVQHGTVDASPKGIVAYNTTVTLTNTADTGYHFVQYDIYNTSNPSEKVTNTSGTFTMPDYDVTVNIIFAPNVTTVKYHANNGTAIIEDLNNTFDAATVKPAVNPFLFGYTFIGWNVSTAAGWKDFNSSAYNASGIWKYTGDHNGNLDVYANFTVNLHNLSVNSTIENGSITVTPKGIVAYNTTVTLTNTANPGYHFVQYDICNTSNQSEKVINSTTFTMPDFNVTVSADFQPNITILNMTDNAGNMFALRTETFAAINRTNSTPIDAPMGGFYFNGWNVSDNPNVQLINLVGTLVMNQSGYTNESGAWVNTTLPHGSILILKPRFSTDPEITVDAVDTWNILADYVNSGFTETVNLTVRLGKDLDFDGKTQKMIGTSAYPFQGALDGNGHAFVNLSNPLFSDLGDGAAVRNVQIRNASVSSTQPNTGLLVNNVASGASVDITNIDIVDSVLSSSGQYAGSLVGSAAAGATVNISGRITASNLTVSSAGSAGGLVGTSAGTVTVTSDATVNLGDITLTATTVSLTVGSGNPAVVETPAKVRVTPTTGNVNAIENDVKTAGKSSGIKVVAETSDEVDILTTLVQTPLSADAVTNLTSHTELTIDTATSSAVVNLTAEVAAISVDAARELILNANIASSVNAQSFADAVNQAVRTSTGKPDMKLVDAREIADVQNGAAYTVQKVDAIAEAIKGAASASEVNTIISRNSIKATDTETTEAIVVLIDAIYSNPNLSDTEKTAAAGSLIAKTTIAASDADTVEAVQKVVEKIAEKETTSPATLIDKLDKQIVVVANDADTVNAVKDLTAVVKDKGGDVTTVLGQTTITAKDTGTINAVKDLVENSSVVSAAPDSVTKIVEQITISTGSEADITAVTNLVNAVNTSASPKSSEAISKLVPNLQVEINATTQDEVASLVEAVNSGSTPSAAKSVVNRANIDRSANASQIETAINDKVPGLVTEAEIKGVQERSGDSASEADVGGVIYYENVKTGSDPDSSAPSSTLVSGEIHLSSAGSLTIDTKYDTAHAKIARIHGIAEDLAYDVGIQSMMAANDSLNSIIDHMNITFTVAANFIDGVANGADNLRVYHVYENNTVTTFRGSALTISPDKTNITVTTTEGFSSYVLGFSVPNAPQSGGQTSGSGSGSSRQYGSTIIMPATVEPTQAPTAVPTGDAPSTPASSNPSAQQTQKSPAPVAGLIAGLGIAALVLARLRR